MIIKYLQKFKYMYLSKSIIDHMQTFFDFCQSILRHLRNEKQEWVLHEYEFYQNEKRIWTKMITISFFTWKTNGEFVHAFKVHR